MHILRALLKALDQLDEVIALIRRSHTVEVARDGLMELLDIDEVQARAILDMQLRRLAALERQRIIDDHAELARRIEDYTDILARPERQRTIVSDELAEIVERYGDEHRTRIEYFEGDMSAEDLGPEEDVVVTITRGGYAKRTKTDLYRSQRRGGKGVKGAQLRGEDVVEHFFTTTSHNWLLFFTNLGRVYRAKAYELPQGGRDAKGQHVARPARVPAGRADRPGPGRRPPRRPTSCSPPATAWSRRPVSPSTTRPAPGGLIAVNLREDDVLVGAGLASPEDDLLLVSRKGQSVRFRADDESLRPMGRATSGVTGMRFKDSDHLLAMSVVQAGTEPDVFVVFENGLAKRTPIGEYRLQGRGGTGIQVARVSGRGGDLVGALTVSPEDEIMVVMEKGKIVRSRVDEVRRTGRSTMGVRFATPDRDDAIVAVARNAEAADDEDDGVPSEQTVSAKAPKTPEVPSEHALGDSPDVPDWRAAAPGRAGGATSTTTSPTTQPTPTQPTPQSGSASAAAPNASAVKAPPTGATTPTAKPAAVRRPAPQRPTTRRVRLSVARVDPWSVMEISFLLSVTAGISLVSRDGCAVDGALGFNVFSDLDRMIPRHPSPRPPSRSRS